MPPETSLKRTPMRDLHVEHGARMVAFAGYEMPLSFSGAVDEHVQTRTSSSLFDVSHMRICDVVGSEAAQQLEVLTPSRLSDLQPGRSRYLMLTNAEGGVVDDSIATRTADGVRLVLNASRAEVDLLHLRSHLNEGIFERVDLGLVALQGPRAAIVLHGLGLDVSDLVFMQSCRSRLLGVDVDVSRTGYTGEDGFELAVHTDALELLAEQLLHHPEVEPAGLAARDSLRLEAGLCLYGQELNEVTTPVEAGLSWTIPKDRRDGGDYLGADVIAAQFRGGARRRLVGLKPSGRRPLRAGNSLSTLDDQPVGRVTSGGWGATVSGPVAMAYVGSRYAGLGTRLLADVRGSEVECRVVQLPFVPHRYVRGAR